MTNTNDAPLGTLDRIAFEASKAERARDSRTHGVLHTLELKIHELNYACREAEKVVKGDELLRLLASIRAHFVTPGTPESAALLERLAPELSRPEV